MAVAEPELFADGTCGRQLPAGELLQSFRFGQFCPVKVVDGGDEATVVVGAGDEPDDKSADNGTRGIRASLIAGREHVGFGAVLEAEVSVTARSYAMAQSVRYSDGGSVASMREREDPDPDIPEPTVKLHHWVPEGEIEAYIAAPWVDMDSGERIWFSMSPVKADALRHGGPVTVTWENYDITVHVKKALPPSGDTTTGGTTTTTEPTTTEPTTTTPETTTTEEKKPEKKKTYDPKRPLTPADFAGVVLALYFEWQQTWTLTGFSRGRLVQSLALAPSEETTIELFTWDRTKKTFEHASSFESETTIEDELKTQDATEVLTELTNKDEFELKAGGSVDVQYNPGPVKIKLGGNIEARDKTNADSVVRNTTKSIKEGLHKSVSKVKVQRSSKVTETTEVGSEERVTRKVRNPNLCHTLNLDYYEILTHYAISTTFNEAGMRFCAMIANPVVERAFSRAFIREHEGPLRDALLDRSLASGFDALRFLRARDAAISETALRRDMRERAPLEAPPENAPTPQAGISDEESAGNTYLANLQAAARNVLTSELPDMLDTALTCLGDAVPALGTRKGQVLPHDLNAGKRWLAQQLFMRSYSQLMLALSELAGADDKPAIRDWGPRLASVMPEASSMPRPSQLQMEPQEVREGLLAPAMWGPGEGDPKHVRHAADWGWWWGEVRRVGLLEPEDAGLGALVEQFARVYRAFLDAAKTKAAATDQQKLVDTQQKNQDRQTDDDRIENDFPLRDYAVAIERAEVLERHLREHSDHYSFALFLALPPQEQLDHIDRAMAGITAAFEPGFFQPRVVSQIGSQLLVPLNHEVIPKAEELLALFKLRIDVPAEGDSAVLPSPGLTIEARLGRCSACEEFIEESRRLDIELRKAELRQALAEADRLEKRVAAAKLDDPKPQVPRVAVDLPQRNGTP